ncbi:MAG: hypothetical protein ABIF87_06375 [Pseudomonadota bacterium]
MTDCVHTFCACLEEKLVLFKKYLSATLCMKENFDSWDMKGVFAFFEERQGLIKDIDQIDRRIYRLKKTDPHLMENTSVWNKEKIDRYRAEVKMVIEKLSTLENAFMEKFQNKSKSLRNELLRIRSGRQAIKGYGAKLVIPKFLDMKR